MLTLQDERDIEKAVCAYATGIDRRQYEAFKDSFAEDADCDYSPIGKWSTRQGIADYMEEIHEHLGETMHRLTNIYIMEKPDGVHVLSYFNAVLMRKDGTVDVTCDGYYADVMEKTTQGWRIKKRRPKMIHWIGTLVNEKKN